LDWRSVVTYFWHWFDHVLDRWAALQNRQIQVCTGGGEDDSADVATVGFRLKVLHALQALEETVDQVAWSTRNPDFFVEGLQSERPPTPAHEYDRGFDPECVSVDEWL
jgi:hypothetical protein